MRRLTVSYKEGRLLLYRLLSDSAVDGCSFYSLTLSYREPSATSRNLIAAVTRSGRSSPPDPVRAIGGQRPPHYSPGGLRLYSAITQLARGNQRTLGRPCQRVSLGTRTDPELVAPDLRIAETALQQALRSPVLVFASASRKSDQGYLPERSTMRARICGLRSKLPDDLRKKNSWRTRRKNFSPQAPRPRRWGRLLGRRLDSGR